MLFWDGSFHFALNYYVIDLAVCFVLLYFMSIKLKSLFLLAAFYLCPKSFSPENSDVFTDQQESIQNVSVDLVQTNTTNLGPKKLDKKNRKSIEQLHPLLRPVVMRAVEECARKGYFVRVHMPYRSIGAQNKKYAEGYSKAKGGYSYHNFGFGFDVTPFVNDTSRWDPEGIGVDKGYRGWDGLDSKAELEEWTITVVQIFKAHGLTWGNDKNATHIKFDPAHFQTGIKLKRNNEDSGAVQNVLLRLVNNGDTLLRDGNVYPDVDAQDLYILGGQDSVNNRITRLMFD